jgi:hypothetical protein
MISQVVMKTGWVLNKQEAEELEMSPTQSAFHVFSGRCLNIIFKGAEPRKARQQEESTLDDLLSLNWYYERFGIITVML